VHSSLADVVYMHSTPLPDYESSSDATNQNTPPQSRHEAGSMAMTCSEGGKFATTEGTIYVSKPFRSRSTKKLRAVITFEPRKTHFDTTNEASGSNEFRVRLLRYRASPLETNLFPGRVSLRFSGCHCFYLHYRVISAALSREVTLFRLPSRQCFRGTQSCSH